MIAPTVSHSSHGLPCPAPPVPPGSHHRSILSLMYISRCELPIELSLTSLMSRSPVQPCAAGTDMYGQPSGDSNQAHSFPQSGCGCTVLRWCCTSHCHGLILSMRLGRLLPTPTSLMSNPEHAYESGTAVATRCSGSCTARLWRTSHAQESPSRGRILRIDVLVVTIFSAPSATPR
jgi:hypothetical protein